MMSDDEQPWAPGSYKWPGGKRWAFALSVDVDGESPFLWRTRASGFTNIAELEQRRFGPKVGVFRLADLFARMKVPATFFVPGYIAETYPTVVPMLATRGFEVGLHGYMHEYPEELSRAELQSLLEKSNRILSAQSGQTLLGHRAPGWRVTEELVDVLLELGVGYDSSLMGRDHPYRYRGLNELPVNWVWDDSPFFRYAGASRDSWYAPTCEHVEHVWREECEGIRSVGGLFVLTLHPWNSGRGSRLLLLQRILNWVLSQADVWVADLRRISDHNARQATTGAAESRAEEA